MKKIIFILALSISFAFAQAQSQLAAVTDIIRNTFQIQTDTATGTSFVQVYKGVNYLVTARHLFKKNIVSGSTVSIKVVINKDVYDLKLPIYFSSNKGVDVAVIKSDRAFTTLPLWLKQENFFVGQDCNFYGFPMGLSYKVDGAVTPILKRGTFSGGLDFPGDVHVHLIDGHNNHGFSGGPVTITNSDAAHQTVIGVVSGYLNEDQDIQFKNKKGVQLSSAKVNENSGIIVVYPISYVKEIIDDIK